MKASRSALFFLLLASAAAFAQQDDREIIGVVIPREQQEARNRVELSKSRSNYPVTPGDLYALTYWSAGKEVAADVLVESDYTLNLNVFGKTNGKGLTFPQLKARVESIITNAYPNGLPYLSLSSVGMFQVYLMGEVPQTRFVTAWGLTRLSEIVMANLTPYSSTREVEIINGDGLKKKYDLYKALQRGILEEDPFIRPGDTIDVHRRGKQIELQGEVVRPGKYEILGGERIQEVIESYGGGFTIRADRSRLRLLRVGKDTLQAFHLDLREGISNSHELLDGDVLSVPSKSARLPVVVFEGAVAASVSATPQGTTEPGTAVADKDHSQLTYPFAEGDTLYDALLAVKDSFQSTADLANSYLVRQNADQAIPIDLDSLLYRYDPANDLPLLPGDRVVIPRQRFYSVVEVGGEPRPLNAVIKPEDRVAAAETLVPVVGGVYSPGAYSFAPGKTYLYYLNLAGGINPELNSGGRVIIRDPKGKRVERSQVIRPGDAIYVRTNDFIYNFNRFFPLISSTLTLLTATVTLVDYFSR
jgi:polysaccharide export outer membrane protein